MEPLSLFTAESFDNGSWVKKLHDELAPGRLELRLGLRERIACKWEPQHKVWRGTIPYQQWLQYQLPGTTKFFWSGKPAVMLSGADLFSGYYVERGLPRGSRWALCGDYVMDDNDPKWDWSRFKPLLDAECDRNVRSDQPGLTSILQSLPEERRCILVCDSTARLTSQPRCPLPGTAIRLASMSALPDAKKAIDAIRRDHWIDVIVGVEHTRKECLDQQDQTRIFEGIVDSLKVGYRLFRLVSPDSPY